MAGGWRQVDVVLEGADERLMACSTDGCIRTAGHEGRHYRRGMTVPKPAPKPTPQPAAGELVEVVVKLRVPLEELIRIAREAGR